MNAESAVSDEKAASHSHHQAEDASARLHDAVHAMAQPLTALAFLLELARMQDNPEVLRNALGDATTECMRAFHVLEEVRDAVHALDGGGGWRQ